MAEIKRFAFVHHVRADSSVHLLHFRSGVLKQHGRGLSFWFLPMSASLAEVPAAEQAIPFAFGGKSADFQEVSVQGAMTWRALDPLRLAEHIDFSVDLDRGTYLRQPLESVAARLVTLAQQHADASISKTPLREVLTSGQERLRDLLTATLVGSPELTALGLSVTSVRVTALRPKPDLEKAMEAPMREHIQQNADEAAFSRRAMAVEKERAIRENELQNQIALAKREEELIAQKGLNERRQATESGEAKRLTAEAKAAQVHIESSSDAEKLLRLGKAQAEKDQIVGTTRIELKRRYLEARLAWEKGRVDAAKDAPPQVLWALAAQELAKKLEHIDHVNLSPDAISPAMVRLMEAGVKKLGMQQEG